LTKTGILKRIFYLLFLLFSVVTLKGQGYKEFWFVAPEIYQAHGDRDIYIIVSTTTDTAHINLRQPARPLFTPIIATILPNSTLRILLTPWIDSIENKPANTVLNYGLYLTSDKQVNAYYEEASTNNPELFTLKGKNAMGTDFYIDGQYHYKNHWPATSTAEMFDIVATEDNTLVTITVSNDIVGHAAGSTFTVTLNKAQTYSARSTNSAASISLAGSHITSNHPIAITIGDDSIDEPETGSAAGWDMIGDQIIPTNLLGKEYIAVMGYGNSNDERVYIEGVQNGTDIYLDGSATPAATINAGQNFWSHFTNNTLYIKSSKPVMAYHLSGFTNEAGSAILPPDSCTGSRQIGFYRSGNGTFAMMLLTRNGNQGNFILDGSTALITAADFSPVTGTSNNWVYARKSLTTAQVNIGPHIITNTGGKFHMGILNNLGGSAEYGFFSDFSSLYLGADTYLCPGDSVQLDAGAYMTSYSWFKLISGTWTPVGTQENYWVSDSGYYACVTNGDYCTLADTIHYGLYPRPVVNLGRDTTICEGASITLDPGSFLSYHWQNGFIGRYYPTSSGGTYWVEVTDNNGCKAIDSIVIATDSLPKAAGSISGLIPVCQGQNGVTYTVTPLPYATTYDWIPPAGATGSSTTASISLNFSVSATSDTLHVRGYNVCGYGPYLKLPIPVDPLPGPAGAIAGLGAACAGQSGVVFSVPSVANATSYVWSLLPGMTLVSGAGTNTITVDLSFGVVSGNISVHGHNYCGDGPSSSFLLTIYPIPNPVVTGPAGVCVNSTTTYSTAAGMSNYTWSVSVGGNITSGTGTNTINILWSTNGTKTISVNYNDLNGCRAGVPSTYDVFVNDRPVPSLNGLNTICPGNSAVYTTDTGMSNYSWLVSAGGTVSGGGTNTDSTVTITWNTSGAQTVSVNYTMGTGCTGAIPRVFDVNVKPKPSVTNPANSTLCSNSMTNIPLFASLPLTTFTWAASGSSGNVSGFSASGGPVISQILVNSGFNLETVTYSVTPSLNGCDGPAAPFVVTVNPVADVYFTPNGQTLCSGTASGITLHSHVALATYTWTASGSSGSIGGFGPGNLSPIAQTLTNTGFTPGSVTYSVSPSYNGCAGIPDTVGIIVDPLPAVTFSTCNDVITTTAAQAIKLKGGLPLNGIYSGTGVNTGYFYPSLAGTGNHILSYSYVNTWGCIVTANHTITVTSPASFTCGDILTDPRDSKIYPTVKLGTQCWMAANLDYGSEIISGMVQRDNCTVEKYCFNDIPGNCTSSGGLYTWDELMQYEDNPAGQGLCPPGWHVPVENEWNTLFGQYISNGFAGAPLKYTGFSGFNALLDGLRFKYKSWGMDNFATLLWSSSSHGSDKAWSHGMNSYNPSVSFYPASRSNAFVARCIKD
jgi:uncharacterized protein (TIGR02145 family)